MSFTIKDIAQLSVAGLSRRKPAFDPRPSHEGFMVNKLELELVFLRVLWF